MKSKIQENGITEGVIWKQLLLFFFPLLLGTFFQQLYNTVDAVIVGRFVGKEALAAVGGAAAMIVNLFVGFFTGVSTGATVTISQFYGGGAKKQVREAIHTAIAVSAAAGVAIMAAGLVCAPAALRWMNTPPETMADSIIYIRVYFCGMVGNLVYNMGAGILRAMGDSKRPLYFLIASCLVNIVLDILFVASFGMGVAGVALATAIAQALSAVLCFWKLLRMSDIFDMKKKYLKLHRKYAITTIRLGLPSGLTQAIFSMAMIIVQSLTNSFGEMFIAANVIVMRVDGFAMMPNFSFETAMTTYAGQNVGAHELERVDEGAKQGTFIAMGVSAAITALILIFGKYLMGIFTDTSELVDMSMRMMRILAVGYVAMAVTQSLSGVMRGAGDTMTPMWISLITTVGIRVPVAYGIAYLTRSEQYPGGRCESIFFSLLFSWTLGAVVTFICYRWGKWKQKAIESV